MGAESLQVGQRVPVFNAVILAGQSIRLADLQGRSVLLSFVSGWRQPCRQETKKVLPCSSSCCPHNRRILQVMDECGDCWLVFWWMQMVN